MDILSLEVIFVLLAASAAFTLSAAAGLGGSLILVEGPDTTAPRFFLYLLAF